MRISHPTWLWRALVTLLGFASSPFLPAQPAPAAYVPGPNSRAITYHIALTDRLRIHVFQEDDLSIISRVDSKGEISPMLLEPIKVVGLTISEAEDAIEQAYQTQRLLRKPQVTITVEEYAAREVIVQGEVLQPGRIPLPIESGMTVLDAITKAGGLSDIARGNGVTVTRTMPDGTKQVTTVDVASILKGRQSSTSADSSMLLLPDDIVYVPMKLF